MNAPSKSATVRWLSALVVCTVALAACGRGSTPVGSTEVPVKPAPSAAAVPPPVAANPSTPAPNARRVPFCLPGERVVCTLGPPPVCHCE